MLYPILISSIIMLVLDITYLSTFGKPFVDQTVMIQKSPFELNYVGALASYLCLILGLNYFVILKQGSLQDAFVLGFVMYGVYDATNMALLKKWLPDLALMDTLWGAILMTATTYFTYQTMNMLKL
jgi:uncharacterized membrane protein